MNLRRLSLVGHPKYLQEGTRSKAIRLSLRERAASNMRINNCLRGRQAFLKERKRVPMIPLLT
jgi:hypothetical protein